MSNLMDVVAMQLLGALTLGTVSRCRRDLINVDSFLVASSSARGCGQFDLYVPAGPVCFLYCHCIVRLLGFLLWGHGLASGLP